MKLQRVVTPETRHLLERIYRHSRHHQVRQRAHCLLLHSQDFSISQLMVIFSVGQKTIYNWLNEWEERSIAGLYNRPGRGRKPTFDADQKAQIKHWAKQYPRQLKHIVQKVQETWNITVSTQTIKRVLKSLRMSWHRFRRGIGRRPNPQEYAQKQVALEILKRLDESGAIALYYMDETGFSLTPTIPYGWQPIGETEAIPSTRSRQLNILGFMQRQGFLESYVSTQSITSDVVIACIEAFFSAVDKATVIVMDPAPIHTSYAMQDKLEEWKASDIYIFELPTYSPELNQIEILWRFMKYDWLEAKAYESWQSLREHVEEMLCGFGQDFVINFA